MASSPKRSDNALFPLHVFRFQIEFHEYLADGKPNGTKAIPLCSGAFAECSGLEATMEPKVIREGGRNFGAAQRAGPVSFATVILRRGMTSTRHLWQWFELVSQGAYAHRLQATIKVEDSPGHVVVCWQLERALPIKFKAADLNAQSGEIGIEELHLVHEGIGLAGKEQWADV